MRCAFIIFLIIFGTAVQADIVYKSYFDYQEVNLGTTQRLRFLFNPSLNKDVTADFQYEISAHINDNLSSAAIESLYEQTKPYYLGMDNVIFASQSYVVKHRVDRLNLKWKNWTVGREAVSFGVGRIWSPNDLFEPFSPIEIDKDYKVGIDIIKYDQAVTELSDITVLYAPLKDGRSSYVARLRATLMNFGTALFAGKLGSNTTFGASLDGPLRGAGVRFSINGNQAPNEMPAYKFIVGSDYLFRNNLYVVGEYYYNGSGSQFPAYYDWASYLSGNIFNLARHYLALGYSLDFWSLWNSSSYVISNLDDGSRLYWTEINYSLSDESNIKSGMILTSGRNQTEYGAFSSLVYMLLGIYL
jgi:hypothetical protein